MCMEVCLSVSVSVHVCVREFVCLCLMYARAYAQRHTYTQIRSTASIRRRIRTEKSPTQQDLTKAAARSRRHIEDQAAMRATACLALLCVALGIAALNTYSVGQKEAALEEQPVAARIPRWLHSEQEIAALRCVLQPQLKYVLRLVQLQRQQDCNE